MGLQHQNDPDLIRALLMDPGVWAVVGLSTNRARTAHRISRWLHIELGKPIVPIHPRAETVHGAQGYASLADVPDGNVKVVDCFVNSQHVGAVVDDAIEQRERLGIDAVWMQLGVVDEEAAERARAAGIAVVMDTCPKIEWPRLRHEGMQR
ncbi:CoA-binding protein [Fodinibacter luteus]|uniref:CoA-binding protein n=1 Tax=Fodinibacter luteus TaxID=552064 RepID=A0ABP8JZ96_9MICO